MKIHMIAALLLTQFVSITSHATVPDTSDHLYPVDSPFYSKRYSRVRSIHAPDRPLKFVSYNIHWSENLDGVIADLKNIDSLRNADVYLLQEVAGTVGGDNTARVIAQALNLNYVYSPGCVLYGKDYGNAILSRWPLKNFYKANLPHSELNVQRTALGATVQVGDREMQALSIHLSVKFPDSVGLEHSRVDQVREAITQTNRNNLPTFFSGDFNKLNPFAWSNILGLFRDSGYVVSHGSMGWTFRDYRLPLDFAFTRGSLETVRAGNEYSAGGSDHIPIWAEVNLK
ncbi:MAG: endonuclease/exonuclease/phosphatase family protein [Methylotenera sp.]|nr:endonuclease/exonuclease/phosphatase family protein [Oligoflexia bacterium]